LLKNFTVRSLQRRLGKNNFQHIKRLCRDRGQLFDDQGGQARVSDYFDFFFQGFRSSVDVGKGLWKIFKALQNCVLTTQTVMFPMIF
jgi:hypothetical protein